MSKIAVRYIVNNVDEAIEFYSQLLGFSVAMHPAPGFAALEKGNLQLFLNAPGAGGAGQEKPEPGGWNRFQLQIEDLESFVEEIRKQGATFRNEIVTGKGGKQILIEDPSGNSIELFESYQK